MGTIKIFILLKDSSFFFFAVKSLENKKSICFLSTIKLQPDLQFYIQKLQKKSITKIFNVPKIYILIRFIALILHFSFLLFSLLHFSLNFDKDTFFSSSHAYHNRYLFVYIFFSYLEYSSIFDGIVLILIS